MKSFSSSPLLFLTALVSCAILSAYAGTATSYFNLIRLEAGSAPGGSPPVCNDGSPAAFYYSPNPSGPPDRWIIHQQV
tara:strand:- start:138 stop:371 length:234 start_codon:yes stop_codon:yes gene_type:complete